MKTLPIILVALAATVLWAAPQRVKSKQGDLQLYAQPDAARIVCTVEFSESMSLLRKAEDHAFVRALCGQGWVASAHIETVAEPQHGSLTTGDIEVRTGWGGPPLVEIEIFQLEPDLAVVLDRSMREYLVSTLDREQIERHNQEN